MRDVCCCLRRKEKGMTMLGERGFICPEGERGSLSRQSKHVPHSPSHTLVICFARFLTRFLSLFLFTLVLPNFNLALSLSLAPTITVQLVDS